MSKVHIGDGHFSLKSVRKVSVIFFILVLAIMPAWAAKPKVVATISIIGDVLKNVAADRVDLTVLVGADGDAHEYEPTPADSVSLSQAQLVFENGLFLEHWLDKLFTASSSHAKRIIVSRGVKARKMMENLQEVDPHAWQDVRNMILYTLKVRDALIEADPENLSKYEENAKSYIKQLQDLDAWVIQQLKTVPQAKRKLVTNHDALGYFASRYGLEMIGTVIPSGTTEAGDPSAKQTAQLLDLIKLKGVHAIFSENMANPKLVQTLSKEAGVVVPPGLYTDALGPVGSEADSYIKMIKHNVKILKDYLK